MHKRKDTKHELQYEQIDLKHVMLWRLYQTRPRVLTNSLFDIMSLVWRGTAVDYLIVPGSAHLHADGHVRFAKSGRLAVVAVRGLLGAVLHLNEGEKQQTGTPVYTATTTKNEQKKRTSNTKERRKRKNLDQTSNTAPAKSRTLHQREAISPRIPWSDAHAGA